MNTVTALLGRYTLLRRQGLGHAHALDILLREFGLLHRRFEIERLISTKVKELDL